MIIITGSLGFIGSNLLATLNEQGHDNIIVCDYDGDKEKKRNITKHKYTNLIEPSALPSFLDSHKDEIEVVFHMGAVSSTVEKNISLITESNFKLPLYLWNWCTDNNTTFLYASSAATYGDGSNGFIDNDSLEYLLPLSPLNPYGRSKNLFDIKAAKLARKGRTPPQWAGFKFFNVYGPNEYHKAGQQSVICQAFKQLNETHKIRLFKSYRDDYADGGQLRDFVYVKDCCDIMLWFMHNKPANGLFNIGTGKARSFNDLAHCLFKSCDISEPQIEYFDMPEQIRESYQYFTEASLEKLVNVGYDKPFTSLEDGVEDYVKNYLNLEDPYR